MIRFPFVLVRIVFFLGLLVIPKSRADNLSGVSSCQFRSLLGGGNKIGGFDLARILEIHLVTTHCGTPTIQVHSANQLERQIFGQRNLEAENGSEVNYLPTKESPIQLFVSVFGTGKDSSPNCELRKVILREDVSRLQSMNQIGLRVKIVNGPECFPLQ